MPQVLDLVDGSTSSKREVTKKEGGIALVKKSFSMTYVVLGDTLLTTEDDVYDTTGIPRLYSLLRGALCKSLDAKVVERIVHPVTGFQAELWEVTANFDSEIDNENEENDEDNNDPTGRTPTISWSGGTEEEVFEEDAITGDAILNTVGEKLLVMTPVITPVLSIKRYETFPFEPNIMLNYGNRVNEGAFWGAPAGACLMLPMEVEDETVDKVRYAVVTYKVKFRIKPGVDEPWKAKLLNEGTLVRPAAGEHPIKATDGKDNARRVNLAENGTKLALGADPIYVEYNRFAKANFNALNLGPYH